MLLLIDLLLFIVAALLVLGFATQIVIPLKDGTPLFPLFRKSEISEKIEDAAHELEEVAELEKLDELQKEINRRKAQLRDEE